MSTTNIKHMQDLYELGGGVMRIAADLKIHSMTVERWIRYGIPDKYFIPLNDHYGITYIEFCKLNARVRGYHWAKGK